MAHLGSRLPPPPPAPPFPRQRSEVVTGRYFHNLANTPRNRWDSNAQGMANQCMHINETLLDPAPTFAEHMGASGYAVGMFGKYLNLSPRQVRRERRGRRERREMSQDGRPVLL